MADATTDEIEAQDKTRKSGLVVAILLVLAGAGAGYFAYAAGLVPFGPAQTRSEIKNETDSPGAHAASPLDDVAYVDLGALLITLGKDAEQRHLRFHAQVEVEARYQSDVEKIRPRILDVLNGYLRALELADLTDPLALTRIRGHLIRRLDIVAGEDRIRDLLVTEFVLN
ncbi:MAG: flagellar basal body-associated FliL family protein, partial [Pseudomonadota bacterium]